MTYDQLEQAIRAACNVSGDTELWIFGSQAILGTFQNAPESLRMSIEVDVQPINLPGKVDDIDGALGELSMFHDTHGFYVHGVSIEAVLLPPGWERRTKPVQHDVGTWGNIGRCLEAHDLAASKLAAFRDKDRSYVRILLTNKLVDPEILLARVRALPVDETFVTRLISWIERTVEDLELT